MIIFYLNGFPRVPADIGTIFATCTCMVCLLTLILNKLDCLLYTYACKFDKLDKI